MRRDLAIAGLLWGSLIVGGCSDQPVPPVSPEAPSAEHGWRRLPDDELVARRGPTSLWTGSELLVLGGNAAVPRCPPEADCVRDAGLPLRDGSAYDPLADSWRPLSASPVPLELATGAVVDGTLYALVRDPFVDEASGTFLAYRIDADRWEELAPPAGPAWNVRLVAAGSRIVAIQSTQENGVRPDQAFEPATGTWADLPLDPLTPSFDRAAVWTGQALVSIGIRLDALRAPDQPPIYGAAALDVASAEWHVLPDSGIVGSSPTWFWTGGAIVNPTIGTADGGQINNWGRSIPFGGMLDPATGAWRALPDLPPGRTERVGPATAGSEYVLSPDGWVLHVPTGRWTPLTRPPVFPDSEPAVAWAGDTLVVFGGVSWTNDKPALLDGGWAWLP